MGNVLKREKNEIGPARWKIKTFGFWSNGTRPQCPRPGLEPVSFDPGTSAPTMRPPRLKDRAILREFSNITRSVNP